MMPALAQAHQLHPARRTREGQREFRFTSPDFSCRSSHRFVEGQMVCWWDEGPFGLHGCDHWTCVEEVRGLLRLAGPPGSCCLVRPTAGPDVFKGHGVFIRVDCSVWRSSRVETKSWLAVLSWISGLGFVPWSAGGDLADVAPGPFVSTFPCGIAPRRPSLGKSLGKKVCEPLARLAQARFPKP